MKSMRYYNIIAFCSVLLVLLSSCAKELIYIEESDDESSYEIVFNQENKSLNYSQESAGKLAEYIESHYLKNRLKTLIISGPINGTDLQCIREMAGANIYGDETMGCLDSLDLSQCSFIEGGNAYFIERGTDGYSSKGHFMKSNSIAAFSFRNCCSLNYIILPEGIESIGQSAFEGCSHLLSINLPKSLKTIEKRAFMNCPLLCPDFVLPEGFVIPDGIIEIPDSMLLGCTIMSKVTLPSSIRHIGISAFNGCRDAKFEIISNNLECFGEYAFAGCKQLTGMVIPPTMNSIPRYSFYDCSSITSIEIPENIKSIDSHAFASSGISGRLSLPMSLNHIGNWAFNGTNISQLIVNSNISCDEQDMYWSGSDFGYCKSLKEVIVNEPVSYFELRFVHCDSLSRIIFPKTLKRFGSSHNELYGSLGFGYNFYKCPSLIEIELPNGLDSIGIASLAYTEIKQMSIPNTVSYIGNYAFENCKSLSELRIPESVKNIEVAAFSGCTSLLSLAIPNSVSSIGPSAFRNCSKLKSIVLSNNLKTLEYGTFYQCKELEEISIPEGMERIGPEAFIGCSKLSKISFPSTVNVIENNAFAHCTSLQNVGLPKSLNLLDYGAFYDCSSLESIELPSALDSIGNNTFLDCSKLTLVKNASNTPQNISINVFKNVPLSFSTLIVPHGTSDLYKNSIVWKDFGTIVEQ